MTRLEKPLSYDILYASGDLLLWADLDLLLKDNQGAWHPQTFRMDSGSPITTMPANDARQLGLPMPAHVAPVTHNQTGLEVRSGYLRCQVVGLDSTEFVFPCLFLGDPDTPPDPGAPPATEPHTLLGLSGVVNQLRIWFDGTPVSVSAPYGLLIVEKI